MGTFATGCTPRARSQRPSSQGGEGNSVGVLSYKRDGCHAAGARRVGQTVGLCGWALVLAARPSAIRRSASTQSCGFLALVAGQICVPRPGFFPVASGSPPAFSQLQFMQFMRVSGKGEAMKRCGMPAVWLVCVADRRCVGAEREPTSGRPIARRAGGSCRCRILCGKSPSSPPAREPLADALWTEIRSQSAERLLQAVAAGTRADYGTW